MNDCVEALNADKQTALEAARQMIPSDSSDILSELGREDRSSSLVLFYETKGRPRYKLVDDKVITRPVPETNGQTEEEFLCRTDRRKNKLTFCLRTSW